MSSNSMPRRQRTMKRSQRGTADSPPTLLGGNMTTTVAIKDDMTLSELGQVLVKSGFFADSRDASQAIVKVLAGRELGFGPIASMTGFYIIKGRVSMSANLMAAAVKRSGRYDFRVRKLDNDEVVIEFLEHIGNEWVSLGVSSFTIEDA